MSDAARVEVELLAETWDELLSLAANLGDREWAADTDCPGWTVKDVVSHIVGIESMYAGRPAPEVELPDDLPHVRSDLGRMLEPWVHARRDRPGTEVLAELRELVGERLAYFRGLDDAGWAEETFTPAGPGPVSSLVGFRVFDSWVHEHDIRRAVGIGGSFATAPARFGVQRCLAPLGRTVGKLVAPPEGTSVALRVHGPPDLDHVLGVRDGRAQPVDDVVGDPTVRLVVSNETLVRLSCGRVDADAALVADLVRFHGDAALGARIVRAMAFTP